MELETRLVFIDTCAYQNKNFQFGDHILQKLQNLLEEDKIQLLITDITKKEIEEHLLKKSALAIKKLKDYIHADGKILRGTPELSIHSIFDSITKHDVFNNLNSKFNQFLESPRVENISIKNVNPEVIFNKYFANEPPFISESKKHEFPDAFVLEAVKDVAKSRLLKVYIISTDDDMKAYAEKDENCIHLSSIDELVDLVLRNDDELLEPVSFADSVFSSLEEEIIQRAKGTLEESQFEAEFEGYEYLDEEVYDLEIDKIVLANKTLIEVTEESAEYEVEFEVELTATYILPDYDSSPWDPEDKVYVFLRKNEITKNHKQKYSANIEISYSEGIKAHAEIFHFQFQDSVFILNEKNSEIIAMNPAYDIDE
ncbi:PIN domain-containing protein [Acinetobacter baumannii]|uniref:PIN domain-containing protein n=1 Tax=Acinetobacter baumannii TaxID=470 RepID=UPI00339024C2